MKKETCYNKKEQVQLEELWNMATRTYKEIPENDPYYAEAVHIIGQVQNIAGISKDEATRILKYNTKDLNDADLMYSTNTCT